MIDQSEYSVDQSEVLELTKSIEDMASAKFIQAERKITEILKIVAGSPTVYQEFSKMLADFDFAQEFAKSKIPNGVNNISLKPPVQRERFLAYTLCLLFDMDTGRIDLNRFLQEFYYDDEGINAAYKTFCAEIILPFLKCVNEAFLPVMPEMAALPLPAPEVQDDSGVELNAEHAESVLSAIAKAEGRIAEHSDEQKKQEFKVVSEAFTSAIDRRNYLLIYVLWIGYKYTLESLGACKDIVCEIELILKTAGILE